MYHAMMIFFALVILVSLGVHAFQVMLFKWPRLMRCRIPWKPRQRRCGCGGECTLENVAPGAGVTNPAPTPERVMSRLETSTGAAMVPPFF